MRESTRNWYGGSWTLMWKCPILCRCGPTVRSCSSNTTNRYKLVETCIIVFTLVPIGLKRPNMVTQIDIYLDKLVLKVLYETVQIRLKLGTQNPNWPKLIQRLLNRWTFQLDLGSTTG